MTLLLSLLFSTIGIAVIRMAKNEGSIAAAMLGVILLGFSYFVWDALYITVTGTILTVLSVITLQRGI